MVRRGRYWRLKTWGAARTLSLAFSEVDSPCLVAKAFCLRDRAALVLNLRHPSSPVFALQKDILSFVAEVLRMTTSRRSAKRGKTLAGVSQMTAVVTGFLSSKTRFDMWLWIREMQGLLDTKIRDCDSGWPRFFDPEDVNCSVGRNVGTLRGAIPYESLTY